MGEYKKGGLAWGLHSSESAHEQLSHNLRESQRLEQERKSKAAEQQSKEMEFYDALDRISEEVNEGHAAIRAEQDARDEADELAESRRQAFVASPEGSARAEEARKNIEFFGHPPQAPKSPSQISREKKVKLFLPRLSKILNLP